MSDETLSRQAPDLGQLVRVRGRQWVVSGSEFESVGAGALRTQTLVTLQPLDDDFADQELRVIWELEPGAVVIEKAGLPSPDGFDSNRRLDDFLNAIRWGSATNIDRTNLLAPFRSGIDLDEFQLVPLVRALEMARANLLIADDVGLGKTIEAGLVIQELILRHRARTVLVVCPSAKQIDWQNEMREKFGLDFKIVNSEMLRQLRRERGPRVNPWSSFPRLIASMDWIKQGVGRKLLRDVLPVKQRYPRPFDILVVDEAQNVAPSGSGNYATASLRTQAVRLLAPHFTHHLFLSATPHNGYRESFTSLLELLDDQRFARTVEPDPAQLRQIMVRRLKDDIKDKDGKPFFPKRDLKELEIDYTDEERDIHATLAALVRSRLSAPDTPAGRMATQFVLVLLKKRLFSSPAAFASTLEKVRESLRARPASAAPASRREQTYLQDLIESVRENATDEAEAEEASAEVVRRQALGIAALGKDEDALLKKLSDWADRNADRADSKADAILAWIESHLRPGGEWNDERLILFTEFRDTQAWLQAILAAHGLAGDRLMLMNGSQTPEEREAVKAAFQASPAESPVRILLATDSAAEGINLQNHCRYLIHVEIPWNPNVMEQRNGRIDRHGQRSPVVTIWHPVGKGFRADATAAPRAPCDMVGDAEYLYRTARKVNEIRVDLGSSGQVLSDRIESVMLGLAPPPEPAVQAKRQARAAASLKVKRDAARRAAEAHDRILETLATSQFSPAALVSAVQTALALAGKPALEPASLSGAPESSVWQMPRFGSDSWSRGEIGLDHPFLHRRRPVTFDPEVSRGRDDVVLQHLGSPLVQMSLRLLREELWKTAGQSRLRRIAVRVLPGLETPAAVVHSRLVVTGGDHRRIHEELTLAGGLLAPTGFKREESPTALKDWLAKSQPLDTPPADAFDRLAALFRSQEPSVVAAVEARSRKRLSDLSGTIAIRCRKEADSVRALLDELERNLKAELAKAATPQYEQLLLPGLSLNEAERGELRRDVAALEARLARIPEERIEEVALVERHYASPDGRTFPAAVVFLVPDSSEWRAR